MSDDVDPRPVDEREDRLAPSSVREVLFSASGLLRRGYDTYEVDAFLARVESEIARLIDERAALAAEVQRLRGPASGPGSTAHDRRGGRWPGQAGDGDPSAGTDDEGATGRTWSSVGPTIRPHGRSEDRRAVIRSYLDVLRRQVEEDWERIDPGSDADRPAMTSSGTTPDVGAHVGSFPAAEVPFPTATVGRDHVGSAVADIGRSSRVLRVDSEVGGSSSPQLPVDERDRPDSEPEPEPLSAPTPRAAHGGDSPRAAATDAVLPASSDEGFVASAQHQDHGVDADPDTDTDAVGVVSAGLDLTDALGGAHDAAGTPSSVASGKGARPREGTGRETAHAPAAAAESKLQQDGSATATSAVGDGQRSEGPLAAIPEEPLRGRETTVPDDASAPETSSASSSPPVGQASQAGARASDGPADEGRALEVRSELGAECLHESSAAAQGAVTPERLETSPEPHSGEGVEEVLSPEVITASTTDDEPAGAGGTRRDVMVRGDAGSQDPPSEVAPVEVAEVAGRPGGQTGAVRPTLAASAPPAAAVHERDDDVASVTPDAAPPGLEPEEGAAAARDGGQVTALTVDDDEPSAPGKSSKRTRGRKTVTLHSRPRPR